MNVLHRQKVKHGCYWYALHVRFINVARKAIITGRSILLEKFNNEHNIYNCMHCQ